jgi:hypothetical protein
VYDVTPAALVTAVITELSVIPTTSVPVILRYTDSIWYYRWRCERQWEIIQRHTFSKLYC